MNGTEQRQHKTRTDAISREMADFAEIVETQLTLLRKAVSDERTHRLTLANEQRGYVDNENRLIRQCCQERWTASSETHKRLGDSISELRYRGFWSRLSWLLTGR